MSREKAWEVVHPWPPFKRSEMVDRITIALKQERDAGYNEGYNEGYNSAKQEGQSNPNTPPIDVWGKVVE